MIFLDSDIIIDIWRNFEPIHWFILITMPVLNLEDAFEKIEWYRHR